MKKIFVATATALGLVAAGATLNSLNPAARPDISIAGENTGRYEQSGHYAGESTGDRYNANERFAGENTGHTQTGEYT